MCADRGGGWPGKQRGERPGKRPCDGFRSHRGGRRGDPEEPAERCPQRGLHLPTPSLRSGCALRLELPPQLRRPRRRQPFRIRAAGQGVSLWRTPGCLRWGPCLMSDASLPRSTATGGGVSGASDAGGGLSFPLCPPCRTCTPPSTGWTAWAGELAWGPFPSQAVSSGRPVCTGARAVWLQIRSWIPSAAVAGLINRVLAGGHPPPWHPCSIAPGPQYCSLQWLLLSCWAR